VAGQWVGNSSNGNGLNYQFGAEGISCSFRYDTTLNLTQSGATVGGSMTYTGRGHACTVPDSQAQALINAALASLPNDAGGFPVSGSANAPSLTLSIGGINFSGTYGANTMDLTGSFATPGVTSFQMTLKHTRQ
jgi:hypothetical protein